MSDVEVWRDPDSRYRGMNPKFVKLVWEKRQATAPERPRMRLISPMVKEKQPDVIDIMLKRAVEKYGAVKTPRQRLRSDIEAVANTYGLTYSDLVDKAATNEVVRARSAAMWMLKFSRGMTLPEIGRHFNMDHTGVLAGVNRHMARIDPNSPQAQWIERKRAISRDHYRAKAA
jgi:hypothetical protein